MGAKSGIAVGVAVVILIIAAFLFFYIRRRDRNHQYDVQIKEVSKANPEKPAVTPAEADCSLYAFEPLPRNRALNV